MDHFLKLLVLQMNVQSFTREENSFVCIEFLPFIIHLSFLQFKASASEETLLQKQNCNMVSNIDTKCFYSNDSSFAPAFGDVTIVTSLLFSRSSCFYTEKLGTFQQIIYVLDLKTACINCQNPNTVLMFCHHVKKTSVIF